MFSSPFSRRPLNTPPVFMFSSCSVHLFDPKRFWTLSKVKRAFSTDLTRFSAARCNRGADGSSSSGLQSSRGSVGSTAAHRTCAAALAQDLSMSSTSTARPSRKLSVLEPPSRRPPRRRRRLCRRHLIPPTKSPPLRRAQKWRKIQCTRWPARQSAPSRRPTRPPIVPSRNLATRLPTPTSCRSGYRRRRRRGRRTRSKLLRR